MPIWKDIGPWMANHFVYNYKHSKYYKNKDAVELLIRFISKSDDLICIGGAGINTLCSIDDIIQQFLSTQKIYNIKERGGRRIYHFVYSFSDEEFNYYLHQNFETINLIARDISLLFYEKGFQVFYGIHYNPEKYAHIHFAVNSINFMNGKKYHCNLNDFDILRKEIDQIYHNRCIEQEQQKMVEINMDYKEDNKIGKKVIHFKDD